jgi:hypothetical protein
MCIQDIAHQIAVDFLPRNARENDCAARAARVTGPTLGDAGRVFLWFG